MRPQLVRDCLFAPGDDSVRIHSNRGDFVLTGKHVATWIDQLARYLDGRYSFENLTASMTETQREDVRRLLAVLEEQRVVHDLDLKLPHRLSHDEFAEAASEIAYLDSCVGSGAHRFERFREASILILGSGDIAAAIAERVRELGCLRVNSAEPTIKLCELVPSRLPDLVIACSQSPSQLDDTNRACRSSGRILLPIIVVGEAAWIGPLVRPTEPGCWECARRRLRNEELGNDTWSATPISTALLASRVAFEAFRVLTDTYPAEDKSELVRLDLRSGHGERHRIHPHPLCETCGASVARDQATLEERWTSFNSIADVSTAAVVTTADELVDPWCGILRELGEGDLPQLPYRATRAVASTPTPSGDPMVVVATAETIGESRARAVQRALASYGQALCERHLARCDRLSGMWAWDLVANGPARVHPGAIFVSGTGSSWEEALTSALFEHSVRLLDSSNDWLGSLPEIDLEPADLANKDLTWTRRVAAVIGLRPRFLDLTGELGLPAVAAVIDGACVAHAAATDRSRAAALVIEAVIARWQIGGSNREIRFEMGDLPGDTQWRVLADRLMVRGWRPFAIPLDQDRAASTVCPHLVAVALAPITRSPM